MRFLGNAASQYSPFFFSWLSIFGAMDSCGSKAFYPLYALLMLFSQQRQRVVGIRWSVCSRGSKGRLLGVLATDLLPGSSRGSRRPAVDLWAGKGNDTRMHCSRVFWHTYRHFQRLVVTSVSILCKGFSIQILALGLVMLKIRTYSSCAASLLTAESECSSPKGTRLAFRGRRLWAVVSRVCAGL